jgi:hypothetical protein
MRHPDDPEPVCPRRRRARAHQDGQSRQRAVSQNAHPAGESRSPAGLLVGRRGEVVRVQHL